MRVAWICHFTNSVVQSRLAPSRRVSEFAPWIGSTINIFENRKDIELHIISPHEYISGTREFSIEGIHYHFFNSGIPFWGRHWPRVFKWDSWSHYAKNKKTVKKMIGLIHPSVIHLQGAENPYYSSTIFQFLDAYPVVVALQRINFVSLLSNTQRSLIERNILENVNNISIRTKQMEKDARSINPYANIYWVDYYEIRVAQKQCEKTSDIVFFASVCQEKGAEDLIEAIAIVKQHIPSVKLKVIGYVNRSYKELLLSKASNLMVNENIEWIGYLPSLSEVHNEVSKAKISVLPTYNDTIPGTILESMQLGIPVVSYKTGSIPELNEERENVLLSEVGNVQGLASNMLRLLLDKNLYNVMSKRGVECFKRRYDSQDIFSQHVYCYQSVIDNFQKQRNK